MVRKLGSCALLAALVAVPCAAAEKVPEVEQASSTTGIIAAPTTGGVRLTETAGFSLLEHGVWKQDELKHPSGDPMLPSPTALASAANRAPRSTKQRQSSFRRSTWLRWVYAAENRHGLPRGLLDALIWTESRYDPIAVSRAGAAGLGQLMPGTARDLGVTNRFDPIQNVTGAARYLRQMLDRFGAVHLALAAYNAGPGAVRDARGIPLNGETPEYVRNVLGRWRP